MVEFNVMVYVELQGEGKWGGKPTGHREVHSCTSLLNCVPFTCCMFINMGILS